jgi:CheY-like chemotaxis protein
VVELVVLDYHMPGMDGLAVLAEMRKDARMAEVPVILFTADVGRLKERAEAQGVNAYVEKGTLEWGRLLGEVRRLMGDGTARPAQGDASVERRTDA